MVSHLNVPILKGGKERRDALTVRIVHLLFGRGLFERVQVKQFMNSTGNFRIAVVVLEEVRVPPIIAKSTVETVRRGLSDGIDTHASDTMNSSQHEGAVQRVTSTCAPLAIKNCTVVCCPFSDAIRKSLHHKPLSQYKDNTQTA
mgnify:CR=1 FL=1